MNYATLPAGANLLVRPFKAHVAEEKLLHFHRLLELSPIGPAVFENTHAGQKYGITRTWLENAKSAWLNDFDWRKCEDRINSFPNFKAIVQDPAGNSIDIHFLALFSEKEDAVPIAFFHGWPGSICEFLDILDLLKSRYSPKDLPYHIIVPSLPGYAYSSGPPLHADYGLETAAGALDNLMVGLGFRDGYLAQGGDLGSFVSRILAMTSDSCKGIHVNMMGMPLTEDTPTDELETQALEKAKEAVDTGLAFALEQGTRPSTIGLTLSSSPLALLCWIGEKFLEWSDDDPPLDKILEAVTLYWITDTFPRCLYHNRGMSRPDDVPKMARVSVVTNLTALKLPYIDKPCGYSHFAHEIIPIPQSWASRSCNLVSYNYHEKGGHFAAMERPAELLSDVEDYVREVWPTTRN